MMSKFNYDALDRTLQDLTRQPVSFGGVTIRRYMGLIRALGGKKKPPIVTFGLRAWC